MTPFSPARERALIFLIAAVQFINILDFMMVMPLGPDLATHLGIAVSHLGWIGGSYTASACVAGLVGSVILDRFPRKTALICCLIGLSLATAAGAYSTDLWSLLGARVAAGFFGGPATSVSLAIISDIVPQERRGRAMGIVMGSFSLASIFGIPVGLELARWGGWQLPFFTIGALGLLLGAFCYFVLPPLADHMLAKNQFDSESSVIAEFLKPIYIKSFAAIGITIFGTFLLVPNISTYVQFNLAWPRDHLGSLYLGGGLASLVAMQLGGRWNDKYGSSKPTFYATIAFILTLFFGFVNFYPIIPVPLIFGAFMATNSLRSVSLSTLTSRVPPAPLRARFMSVQSAVQHLLSSLGAFLSAAILKSGPHNTLVGMPTLGLMVIGISVICPFLAFQIEKHLKNRH